MKLRSSTTSPFVRKVMITAVETGQDGGIEMIPTMPWAPDTDLPECNPMGKVPALQTDDGEWLYDSWVICEYLDARHTGPKLTPESGDARIRVMRGHALASGCADAGVAWFLENKRPDGERSDGWIKRQEAAMARVLDALDREAGNENQNGVLKGDLNMAQIAVGCVLGWFDFRNIAGDWRAERPALADFYDTASNRASFLKTAPKDPQ